MNCLSDPAIKQSVEKEIRRLLGTVKWGKWLYVIGREEVDVEAVFVYLMLVLTQSYEDNEASRSSIKNLMRIFLAEGRPGVDS